MNGSAIILSNCNSDSLAQCGIQLDTCTHIQVSGMRITAANTSNGGYSGINLINSTHCTITSCDIAASHGMRSVDENGSSDYNLVQGNQLYVGCQVLGAHSRFRLNLGVNENM
jgi:hypothetical protein